MPISGKEMLAKYVKAGWKKLRRKGSHMIVDKENLRQTIPMHKELKKGLEQKLLKYLEEHVLCVIILKYIKKIMAFGENVLSLMDAPLRQIH